MEYRRLGQTGLEVSTIGLGTNNFGGRIDFEATKKVLHRTMEEGINFLDCANTYGAGKSEEFIGQVLGKEHRQVVPWRWFRGELSRMCGALSGGELPTST